MEQHMGTGPGAWDAMQCCEWWKLVLQAVGKVGQEVRIEIVCLSRQEAEGETGRGNTEEGN